MKSLLIVLLFVLVTLSSCSPSMAPCHTYDKAYKLRYNTPVKLKTKKPWVPFNTVKI